MFILLSLVAVNVLEASSKILRLPCKTSAEFASITKDRALASSFRNIANTDLKMCEAYCIHDQKCKSLNIEEENQICELNDKSAEDAIDNITTQHRAGWTYHSTLYNETSVGKICKELKPCKNTSKCYDTCSCPGYECIEMRSCFDWYKAGMNRNGIYAIVDSSGKILNVYCDLTSGENIAWTLVLSFSLNMNDIFKTKPFLYNFPRNEPKPNWNDYRLSKDKMNGLQSISTHMRATCSFQRYGFDHRDYFLAEMQNINIFTNFQGACKNVEAIDVRGNKATKVTVPFWQEPDAFLHSDSSAAQCNFNARDGAVASEDNFGFYGNQNSAFRCTESKDSTTQYWFGRKVL